MMIGFACELSKFEITIQSLSIIFNLSLMQDASRWTRRSRGREYDGVRQANP